MCKFSLVYRLMHCIVIMALVLTQLLTEMSTRNISWGGGKGGRCVGLTTLPPSYADCLEI